jgi:hypothetical protein
MQDSVVPFPAKGKKRKSKGYRGQYQINYCKDKREKNQMIESPHAGAVEEMGKEKKKKQENEYNIRCEVQIPVSGFILNFQGRCRINLHSNGITPYCV